MLVKCPYLAVDPVAWEAIAAADLLKNGGGWPNGSGWLNECHSLRDAVRYVWAKQAERRAELGLPAADK